VSRQCEECGASFGEPNQVLTCPQCGSAKIAITSEAFLEVVSIIDDVQIRIDYGDNGGWHYQWRLLGRHLAALRAAYTDGQSRGNEVVRDLVDAVLLALWHLKDWVCADQANMAKITKSNVDRYATRHHHLGLARDYANTTKHARRDRPSHTVARVVRYESHGNRVTIGHRQQPEPPGTELAADHQIDALVLAEAAERDWRELLAQHGITIPS
jgi:predicted  nucleic acid-binding Zn-ribbon protein